MYDVRGTRNDVGYYGTVVPARSPNSQESNRSRVRVCAVLGDVLQALSVNLYELWRRWLLSLLLLLGDIQKFHRKHNDEEESAQCDCKTKSREAHVCTETSY